MNILAIESSCDETAAAVVRDGRTVLSNCIASQIEMHTIYGGVVPEIASRKHVEAVTGLAEQAGAPAGPTKGGPGGGGGAHPFLFTTLTAPRRA